MIVLGLVFAVCAAARGEAAPQRPHILLLLAEDMSARVGAFGDEVAVTPHLDAPRTSRRGASTSA